MPRRLVLTFLVAALEGAMTATVQFSHGWNLDNAQFNQARDVYNISHTSEDPFAKLLKHRAVEATHESTTAAYAPKCKPGTRVKVIADIMKLIEKEDMDTPVIWFSGPAGGGKTCIQREVAKTAQLKGMLLGSYFFSTQIPQLDDEKPFVATIAHQLTKAIPGYRELITDVIEHQPGIFDASLDVQLEDLILHPLAALLETTIVVGNVLIIDGFDECRDPKQRTHLLHIIYLLATNQIFRFRVVIASRPEFDIRTAFGKEPLQRLTAIVRLDDYDGNEDIRTHFKEEFARIREEHPSKASLATLDWPKQEDIETLVLKASSQFIFASTVIQYIDNPRRSPVAALRRVLDYTKPKDNDANPFADLDALYWLILHPPDVDIAILTRLLHIILDIDKFGTMKNGWDQSADIRQPLWLDHFLGLEPGTINIVFCDLHSVVAVPNGVDKTTPTLKFHHKSLEDYLRSPKRAGELHQSQEQTYMHLAERCIQNLEYLPPSEEVDSSSIIQLSYENWDKYMRQLHSVPFSRAILDFDPAHIIHAHLREGYHVTTPAEKPAEFEELQKRIHKSRCKTGGCLELCRRLSFIVKNKTKIVEVLGVIYSEEPKDRGVAYERLLGQLNQLLVPPADENRMSIGSQLYSDSPEGDEALGSVVTPQKLNRKMGLRQFWKKLTRRV